MEKRSLILRVIYSLFWLVTTYFILYLCAVFIFSEVSIGEAQEGVENSFNAGRAYGKEAAHVFSKNHIGKFILFVIATWVLLTKYGIYPGVSKYKKIRPADTDV